GGGAPDATGEVPPKIAPEDAEELTVRPRIPLQAADHQRPEALFGLVLLRHWWVDSLAACGPRDCNACDPQTTNREESTAL
ncbi:MAG: hypothetical protein ACYDAE_24125, partial [Steroidobacteraceae bacterium]